MARVTFGGTVSKHEDAAQPVAAHEPPPSAAAGNSGARKGGGRCAPAFGGSLYMMPNWLKGMVGPTLMLWLCALAWGVACIVAPEGKAPKGAGVASGYALPLVLALWISADARKRGKQLFYDYDSFVFFAWPIMMPVYLFQTRRLRAFLTLLCFAGIWLVAMVPFFVVSIIEEFGP